jgi:hypothetical protein
LTSAAPVINGAPDTIPPDLDSAAIKAAVPAELVLVFTETLKSVPSISAGNMLGFSVTSLDPDGLALAAVWTIVTYNIYYWNVMANNDANPSTYDVESQEIALESAA